MASSRREFEKWLARLSWIKDEFPFGPSREWKNEDGKLHREDGPASISPSRCIWFKNGKRHGIDVDILGSITFYFEGILIPRRYFYEPEKLSIKSVLLEKNAEVRYAGIRIVGFEKIISSNICRIIHKTKDPQGRERLLFSIDKIFDNESLTFVAVFNGTPELDGTYKRYFLQVPPSMKTCEDAVAWTFYRRESEYKPVLET